MRKIMTIMRLNLMPMRRSLKMTKGKRKVMEGERGEGQQAVISAGKTTWIGRRPKREKIGPAARDTSRGRRTLPWWRQGTKLLYFFFPSSEFHILLFFPPFLLPFLILSSISYFLFFTSFLIFVVPVVVFFIFLVFAN